MFKLIKKSKKSKARLGQLKTQHGEIKTPFFMPIATKAAVKNISTTELQELGTQIILANTYHLYLRPGLKTIKKAKGLHSFMNWSKSILTDSGGFQVFLFSRWHQGSPSTPLGKSRSSLRSDKVAAPPPFVNISSDGVEFKDHLEGKKHFFTPEKVIKAQLELGSDIIMPLDVCLPHTASKKEHQRAWIK